MKAARPGGHRDGRGARPPAAGLRLAELADRAWRPAERRAGRIIVQRTSAGTQGVVAAAWRRPGCGAPASSWPRRRPPRSGPSGLGPPTYVITGRSRPPARVRLGRPGHGRAHRACPARPAAGCRPDGPSRSRRRRRRRTRWRIGPGQRPTRGHRPAVRVDAFDFAMEASRVAAGCGSNGASRGGSIAAMPHDPRQRPRHRLRRSGRGPPLVLLHGATSVGPRTFAAQIPPLAAAVPVYLPTRAATAGRAGTPPTASRRLAGRRPRGLRRRARARDVPPRRLLDGRR